MAWTGSCNRCGHCGCYEGAGGPAKWYPGIGGSKMPYGKMYPDRDMDICELIRTAFMAAHSREWDQDYGETVSIRITGGGSPLEVDCHITLRGIQKSATDASCPFFTLGSPDNVCELMANSVRRAYLPPSCANVPQGITDEDKANKWMLDHPPCGWSWV